MEQAFADLERAKSGSHSSEELRLQAKATLLDATSSGRLDSALTNLKKSKGAAPEVVTDDLRQQAKATLLEATESGRLDEALASLKKAKTDLSPADQLRLQAKSTLLDATKSGALDKALAAVKSDPTARAAMRNETKSALVSAARNGLLNSVLAGIGIKPSADQKEQVRLQARMLLVSSAKDGSLSDALGSVSGGSTSSAEIEALRQQAMESLWDATSNGKLDSVLCTVKSGIPILDAKLDSVRVQAASCLAKAAESGKLQSVLHGIDPPTLDMVREQAKKTLLNASANGVLENVLTDLRGGNPDIRLQVKNTLLRSAQNGELEHTLQSMKPDAHVEGLRMQAKSTLLDAMSSGQLEKAMAEIRPGSNATEMENLRQDAKRVLQAAAGDGRLQGKLCEIKGEASPKRRVLETPVADITMNPAFGSSASAFSVEMLQTQLAEGLHDTITSSVQGAVSSVMKNAIGELKAEMDKRDVVTAKLSDQMGELKQQVAAMQESHILSLSRRQEGDPSSLFDTIDRDHDGIVTLEEFKKAYDAGIVSEAAG
jgi:hypothetical protein